MGHSSQLKQLHDLQVQGNSSSVADSEKLLSLHEAQSACRVRSAGKSKGFRQSALAKEQPILSEELAKDVEREDEEEDQVADESLVSAV